MKEIGKTRKGKEKEKEKIRKRPRGSYSAQYPKRPTTC
jgi:hypothetical protein